MKLSKLIVKQGEKEAKAMLNIESIKQMAVDVNNVAAASFQSGKEYADQLCQWMSVEKKPFPQDGTEFLTSDMRQGGVLMLASWDLVHHRWKNKAEVLLVLHATHWKPISKPMRREGN